jgi:L-2-hydroxyglutarate oxidase LhgO
LIGLATARALQRRRPGVRLVVLEKEATIAVHQSGHNSGVIHSGIYYKPGSLKAELCVRGAALMRKFCDEHGIRHQATGKLIIAVRPSELSRLAELRRRGDANGVAGLRVIEGREIQSIEPSAAGLRAIHSPTTGIVDYQRVAAALASELSSSSAALRTGAPVVDIRRQASAWQLTTPGGTIQARAVVSCAGLQSDRLARLTGADPMPRIVPFRGEYWRLRPEAAGRIRSLIYPVPDPAFPFLGVHFTPRIDGQVWVGPNALLALAREGYQRRSLDPSELGSLLRWPGFYRLGARYWQMGLQESMLAFNRGAFMRELRRYVPTLQAADLERGSAGVRAQAVSKDGRLIDDFVFSEEENILHVRNAPSPGATASLAIGETIAERLEKVASF